MLAWASNSGPCPLRSIVWYALPAAALCRRSAVLPARPHVVEPRNVSSPAQPVTGTATAPWEARAVSQWSTLASTAEHPAMCHALAPHPQRLSLAFPAVPQKEPQIAPRAIGILEADQDIIEHG